MIIRKILKINIRSILINFYLFPFRTAIKMPVLIARKVIIKNLSRKSIIINSNTIKTGMIQIGYNSVGIIDYKYERSILHIQKESKLIFNGNAFLGAGTRIGVLNKSVMEIGENTTVSGNTNFISNVGIRIGNNCRISWNCLFMDTDFHKIYNSDNMCINQDSKIVIEDNVWIGCNTTILKGSYINNGTVVGASSLVTKKLNESNAIYAGNPVKLIKQNITWNE